MFWLTPLLIAGSIAASTALIMVNKMLMSKRHFNCPTFLTAFHFLLTYSLLEFMGRFHFFEITTALPNSEAWRMAIFGTVSIVFMNINLKVNSIGFYQLSKLCTIPCLVAYKYFALKQTTPPKTLMSLGVLLVGLTLFTVNDVQFSATGSIIAAVAVVTTAAYQTMTGSLQKKFSINGTQLMHQVGFPQFVLAMMAGIVLETSGTVNNIFEQEFTGAQIILILASGACAVLGNVIAFSLIGRAGPVTFQVVGHVKTMLIFIFGLIMFQSVDETPEQLRKKILGLCISMAGVILYTVFEMQAKAAEPAKPAERLVEPEPEEEDPLTTGGDTFQEAEKE